MNFHLIPRAGDVYSVNTNPEIVDGVNTKHCFVIITPQEINSLGVAIAVPIASPETLLKNVGLAVPVSGHDISGVAVCNQICSLDIKARTEAGQACYVGTLDDRLTSEIINRVLSVIEPAVF